MIIKVVGIASIISGTLTVLSQIPMPQVPDDFQSWPATAILGFVTMLLIVANSYLANKSANVNMKSAESLGRVAQAQTETNNRLDELAEKIGRSNEHQAAQTVEISLLRQEQEKRPCIIAKENPE